MATIIVECDACGTKNRIEDDKAETARCGRCKNPLLDAVQEQFELFTDKEEDDEEDDAGEEDEDEENAAGGSLPHGTKFSGSQPTAADVMRDLFGDMGMQIPCKIRCKNCGRMFIGTADQTLCPGCA